MSELPPTISEDEIEEYVDGRLSRRRRAEIAAVLVGDKALAARVQGLRLQNDLLRGIDGGVLDEPVPDRLLDAVRKRPRAPSAGEQARKGSVSGFWPGTRRVAAAILIFIVGGFAGWLSQQSFERGPTEVQRVMSEILNTYAFYTSDYGVPVDYASDQRSQFGELLASIFQREIAFPDLEPQGYRYQGGRILPSGQRRTAFLLFANEDGAKLSIYLWQSEIAGSEISAFDDDDRVATRYWFFQGFGFAVVSPRDAVGIDDLSRSVFSFYEGAWQTQS